MATLNASQRLAIRMAWSALVSRRREAFPLSKTDLDAAVAATDDWQDANQVNFNNALPSAARTQLSAAQKAELFLLVAKKRLEG